MEQAFVMFVGLVFLMVGLMENPNKMCTKDADKTQSEGNNYGD